MLNLNHLFRLTMLGDLIYEHKGKITGQKVLDTVGGQGEVAAAFILGISLPFFTFFAFSHI